MTCLRYHPQVGQPATNDGLYNYPLFDLACLTGMFDPTNSIRQQITLHHALGITPKQLIDERDNAENKLNEHNKTIIECETSD